MKLKKKKVVLIGGILAALIVVGTASWFLFGKSSDEKGDSDSVVYVDSIAEICGLGSGNGLTDRFSGVVEPQKTLDIKLPSDKKVDEIFVKVGDEVKAGEKLFTYSTEEMEENLAQAEIDLDRLANEVEQTKQQIDSLKKEKASASSDAQLSYTTQINTAENDIKRKEYEQKSKKVEIEKLKNGIANATVTSEMDGMVKTINATESEMMSMNGESEAFMTILAVGDFRVKGTINEQNRFAITEGNPVIVHSRVDDSTWTGTITTIDFENPEKDESNMYYMSSSDSSSETSSNYPFYVELDSAEGLMLGQHVYIENDHGQSKDREGIWLDSYYIIQEDDNAYVWAANSKDKIEKRKITLGEFDEEMQQYQVTDGLTEEDYIAFPDEMIKAGDKAEKNVGFSGMEGMDNGDMPEFDGEGMDMEAMPEFDGEEMDMEAMPEFDEEEMMETGMEEEE